MPKTYNVKVAICLKDGTWIEREIEFDLKNDNDRGHLYGEIAEAAEDNIVRLNKELGENLDIVCVGMISFGEITPVQKSEDENETTF